MSAILMRSLIIFIMCSVVQIFVGKYAKLVLDKKLINSSVIAVSPFIVTFVPLLGMNKLMNTGMQPLFSTLLLFGVSYIIQIGLDKTENSNPIDKIFKEDTIDLKFFEVDTSFFVILTFTLTLELLAQISSGSMEKRSQIDNIVKGMEKFYKKYDLKLK